MFAGLHSRFFSSFFFPVFSLHSSVCCCVCSLKVTFPPHMLPPLWELFFKRLIWPIIWNVARVSSESWLLQSEQPAASIFKIQEYLNWVSPASWPPLFDVLSRTQQGPVRNADFISHTTVYFSFLSGESVATSHKN